MTTTVDYGIKDNIAIITLSHPPVNALSHDVRAGIAEGLTTALQDATVKAIVFIGNDRFFSAGADITEFESGAGEQAPTLPDVVLQICAATKPVIALVSGDAFGGGLELALACQYRVAREGVKVGLPQVKIGIIPGAGGTQLLPRIAGIDAALDMIVSGRPVDVEEASAKGLVGLVAPKIDFLETAIAYASDRAADAAPLDSIFDRQVDTQSLEGDVFQKARAGVARKNRGEIAPGLAIDVIEASATTTLTEGMQREAESFAKCAASPEAKALQHLFFAERAARKVEGVANEEQRRSIKQVGVIGSGTMGGGIAMSFANAGFSVVMLDLDEAALTRGMDAIRNNYEISAKRGRFSVEEAEARVARIHPTTSYEALSDADLVIEAVFENMDIKKKVFGALDAVCKAGAILASNTSTLDVNEIAASTSRPQDVIGLHFFSPANVMKLLEIVRGDKTASDVIATCVDLAGAIGKIPVVVGVCFGFVGNRMLGPYGREANRLLLEGASAEQIDRVLTEFGFAMGVVSMSDLAGIDVGHKVREGLTEDQRDDPSTFALADKLYELGRYGQKTARGFYFYEGRNKTPDPEVITLAEELAPQFGIVRREISDQEILERCLYPLINEGAAILDEGIAARASDIDVVYAHGYGFPKGRGGPMFYGQTIGFEKIAERMNAYREELGDYGERYFKTAENLLTLS